MCEFERARHLTVADIVWSVLAQRGDGRTRSAVASLLLCGDRCSRLVLCMCVCVIYSCACCSSRCGDVARRLGVVPGAAGLHHCSCGARLCVCSAHLLLRAELRENRPYRVYTSVVVCTVVFSCGAAKYCRSGLCLLAS